MKVLIACEFSGIIRGAFKARGHDAWSCDLLGTEIPGQHYKGDVLDIINNDWDLIIAHPPCTYISNSGNRWLYDSRYPQRKMQQQWACKFFNVFLNGVNCEKVCVENPIPGKKAKELLIRNYDQLIQPNKFGHGETKATCLWLKGLPKLVPTDIVEGREQRIFRMAPGPNRSKERSRTFPGIAKAMAEQWG